jgi:3-isopropylmalate/(R)-2-methylmalate dehydratase small subunit
MRFTSRVVALPLDNVDTDQIIPARFLTVTGKDRLADALFADWRTDPSFPLNQQTGEILLAGHNFGCGSSREHAVWALQSYGFRAVISTAFADIFRNNALGNGLLPIQLSPDDHEHVLRYGDEVTVDLASQTIGTTDGWSATFPVNAFAKHCLLTGTDALGYLIAADDDITRYEVANAR